MLWTRSRGLMAVVSVLAIGLAVGAAAPGSTGQPDTGMNRVSMVSQQIVGPTPTARTPDSATAPNPRCVVIPEPPESAPAEPSTATSPPGQASRGTVSVTVPRIRCTPPLPSPPPSPLPPVSVPPATGDKATGVLGSGADKGDPSAVRRGIGLPRTGFALITLVLVAVGLVAVGTLLARGRRSGPLADSC